MWPYFSIYESMGHSVIQAGRHCILRKGPLFLTVSSCMPLLENTQQRSPSSSSSSFLTSSSGMALWGTEKVSCPYSPWYDWVWKPTCTYQPCPWISRWVLFGLFQKPFLWFTFLPCKRSEKQPNILATYEEKIALTGDGGPCFPRIFLCISWVWGKKNLKSKQIKEPTNKH